MVKKHAAMKEVYAADHLEMQSHIRRYTRERDEIHGKPVKKSGRKNSEESFESTQDR